MSEPQRSPRRRMGLKWKIMGGLVSGVMLFGILVVGVVNYQMTRVLRTQMDQRALDIATNLGDSAAANVMQGGVLELSALVRKYSLLPGVAYTLIRNGKGEVIANSLGTLPAQLRESWARDSQGQSHQREFQLRERTVYETSSPILQGRVGTVSVGIWADIVEEEIRRAIYPLIGLIGLALAASLIFSILVTQGITRRVLRLKDIADKVSMGDLESPVRIESNDEIGDLAHSLERMRASLKAAMVRLNRA
jgi:HAMP domain-containing protein